MITDKTKLFSDLTKLFIKAYENEESLDLRQDPEVIPIYDINNNIWLEDGIFIRNKHIKPVYIRYTTSASLNDGKAIRLGVTTEPNGTEYKYYYMAPVYYDDSNMTYEINLNEILSRDLNRGVLNTVNYVIEEYTINNTTWEITETTGEYSGEVQLYPDNYSRTTVIDDIFLFNSIFNRIREYLTELEVYNKPIITVEGNSSDKTYISQFEDMILKVINSEGYYACTVKSSGPEDSYSPTQEEPYDNKFNLLFNGDDYYTVHLNGFYKDMVIGYGNRTALDFKYILKGASDSSSDNITINYYYSDDNVNTENLKSAFREIHKFI